MKKITYIVMLFFISVSLTSCVKNDDLSQFREEVLADRGSGEKEILDKLANNIDYGFYEYATYRLSDGKLLFKYIYGHTDDIDITIDNYGIISIKIKDRLTYINPENNKYCSMIGAVAGNNIENEDNVNYFYQNLYHKGSFDLFTKDDHIFINFSDGTYKIYDKNNLYLIESKYLSKGNEVVTKLEHHSNNVDEVYDKYINSLYNMEEVSNLDELRDNWDV